MRLNLHRRHSHRNERRNGDAKWKGKKRLVTTAAWIIGVGLIVYGLYILFSGSGTFQHVVGGLIFLAGAFLLAFLRELRNWILMKW